MQPLAQVAFLNAAFLLWLIPLVIPSIVYLIVCWVKLALFALVALLSPPSSMLAVTKLCSCRSGSMLVMEFSGLDVIVEMWEPVPFCAIFGDEPMELQLP